MDKATETQKKIFLSHTHADGELVGLINRLLKKVFSGMFYIFDTSNNPLDGGSKWRDEVRTNLEDAIAVLVIITPRSKSRDWVFFEAGASWNEAEARNKRLIPCRFHVDKFPSPLSEYIGYDLSVEHDIRKLVQTLKGLIPIDPDPELIDSCVKEYIEEINKISYDVNEIQDDVNEEITQYKTKLVELVNGFFDEVTARKFIKVLSKHDMIDDELVSDFLRREMKRKF